MKRDLNLYWILAVAVLLIGCSKDPKPNAPAPETGIAGIVRIDGASDHTGILVVVEKTVDGTPSRIQAHLDRQDAESYQDPRNISAPAEVESTVTAADGSYRLTGLAAGTYTLCGAGNHALRGFLTGLTVTDGQITSAPPLVLKPTGDIGGTVQLQGESDHSGSVIFVAGTSFAAFTDSLGRYTISGVPVGTHALTAAHWGFRTGRHEGIIVQAGETADAGEMTLSPGESASPRVLLSFPADGETLRVPGVPSLPPGCVPPPSSREIVVVLQFSSAMNLASFARAISIQPSVDFTIQPSGSDILALIASTGPSEGARDGRVGSHPLRFGTTYALTLSTEAAGVHGDTLIAPFHLSFTTGGFEIVRTSPADGSTVELPSLNGRLWVNAEPDPNLYSEPAIVTTVPETNVGWYNHLAPDGHEWNTAIDFVAGPLRAETEYEIRVSNTLADINGRRLAEPYVFHVMTGPVRVFGPEIGSEPVPPTQPASLFFNTTMDSASVEAAVSVTAEGIGVIPTLFAWENLSIVSLRPSLHSSWPASRQIRVAVGATAKDSFGTPLRTAFEYLFVTEPPTVAVPSVINPVPPWADFSLAFSAAMDPTSVEDAISATAEGLGAIVMQLTWLSEMELRIQGGFQGTWPPGRQIQITLGTGAHDVYGTSLSTPAGFTFTTGGVPVIPQSSPENCLAILRQAYIDRSIDNYWPLFTDDFIFVFTPEDVNNPNNPTPASWGVADERTSATHMFASELVEKIELNFGTPQVEPSSEFPGASKADVTNIDLRVSTRKADGTPLTLWVNPGRSTFYFKEFPEEHASDGRTLWRIFRWVDMGVVRGPLMVENATWGKVKAAYR